MKQQIGPKVFIPVLALVVVVIAFVGFKAMSGPTVAKSPQGSRFFPKPSPGPTPAQLEEMRRYNAEHMR